MMSNPSNIPNQRGGAARVWLLLAVLLVVGGALWLGSRPTPQEKIEAPPTAFENASTDVAYVGSEACRSCHAEAFASHHAGFHAKSFAVASAADEALPARFSHRRSGLAFEIRDADGAVEIEEYLPGADGREVLQTRKIRYALGSGHGSRRYIAELDGFLVPAPIQRESDATWGMALGMDRPDRPSFSQTLESVCLECHVGRLETPDWTRGRHEIKELAIGCESCHGPGALHVSRWQAAGDSAPIPGEPDLTIVSFKQMTQRQSMDACNRCHLSPQFSAVHTGRHLSDWRPGMLLRTFRTRFGEKDRDPDPTRDTHVDQLRRSACYQQSEDMTCVTCHGVHDEATATDRAAYYRDRCLACHQGSGRTPCGVPEEKRRETTPEDACSSCHMQERTGVRPHLPRHDHWIRVPGKEPADAAARDVRPKVVALDDMSHLPRAERDRAVGLASLYLSWLPGRSETERLALVDDASTFLESALDQGLADARLQTALATIYKARKQLKKSVTAAQAAIEDPEPVREDVRATALLTAIELYMAGLELDRARTLLAELTQLRREASDWALVAVIAREQGNREEMLRAAERMLEIAPHDHGIQWQAADLFRELGMSERAEYHAKLGTRLDGAKDRNR